MTDYLLKVKVQNNRIISLMRKQGIENIAELARQVKISRGIIDDLVNMKMSPLSTRSKDGVFLDTVLKLADFFGVLPDEMFNQQQLTQPLPSNKAERSVELDQVVALMGPKSALALEDSRFEEEKQKVLDDVLNTLTDREREIITKRFGLQEDPKSLQELGKEHNVTGNRIMQIEWKALRKLRQTLRSTKLKQIDEEFTENDPFDFKSKVTFMLKENQKQILIRAGNNWGQAAINNNIHRASAAKFIHELRETQNKQAQS